MLLAALLPLLLFLQEPDPDWTAATLDELVEEVRHERDQADPAVLEELGRRGTPEAVEALRRCSGLIASEEGLNRVFAALARIVASHPGEDQDADARVFLVRMAVGQSWAHRRPAARALASLGGLAESELRLVLRDSADPRCRQLACGGLVPALVVQGDAEALEALLAWYRPPTSGPEARLVRALGRFQGEWVLPALEEAVADRGRPAPVRAAVVRSLAEREAEAAGELIGDALRAREPEVQLAAIDATVERSGEAPEHVLERLARSRDGAVRKAAFEALDRLRAGGEEWEEELEEAAEDRDLALRLAAVEAYARRPGAEALEALLRLADDPSHLVRAAALRALAPRRARETIPVLLDVLEEDTRRLRELARDVLVELTGLDHGRTPVRWRAWWQAEGATYELPAAVDAERLNALREERRRENPTQAEFYGVPLGSDRVCFVLDTSGSMDRLVTTGGTRLEAAVAELAAALEGFPAGGRFNLVFFSGRVRAWKPGLVEMDERRLEQASRYARAQRPNGGTALYEALLEALEDEEVDTIVVLSDGQPTAGELTDPENILADIEHRNRLRGVVFHCVALAFRSDLLEGLAEISGGSYREVQ